MFSKEQKNSRFCSDLRHADYRSCREAVTQHDREGAGPRLRGSGLGSGRSPHCRAWGLRFLQLRVQTAPQDSSPSAHPTSCRGRPGTEPGAEPAERTLACEEDCRKPTGIESQQEEEPGWAGPAQAACGARMDQSRRPAGPRWAAGDTGQKLHFLREGKGDLSGKRKVTEGSLSGQWERQSF